MPWPPVPAAVLWFTADQLMVIVPWFTMPAPLVVVAVLFSTSLPMMEALPPFAMPPAASEARWGRGGRRSGRVAVHLTEEDCRACSLPGGSAARAVAARDAAAPTRREVFPLTWLTFMRDVTGEVLDAAAPTAFGAVLLFTWLKLSVSWPVGPG